MKKYQIGLGALALGLATSLCSCATTKYKTIYPVINVNEENTIKMDVTGYKITTDTETDESIQYFFKKYGGYEGGNHIKTYGNGYQLCDGYYDKLDGKVEQAFSNTTWVDLSREDMSEEQAKQFDELLAQYQKSLNVDKVHKEWEERYNK